MDVDTVSYVIGFYVGVLATIFMMATPDWKIGWRVVAVVATVVIGAILHTVIMELVFG